MYFATARKRTSGRPRRPRTSSNSDLRHLASDAHHSDSARSHRLALVCAYLYFSVLSTATLCITVLRGVAYVAYVVCTPLPRHHPPSKLIRPAGGTRIRVHLPLPRKSLRAFVYPLCPIPPPAWTEADLVDPHSARTPGPLACRSCAFPQCVNVRPLLLSLSTFLITPSIHYPPVLRAPFYLAIPSLSSPFSLRALLHPRRKLTPLHPQTASPHGPPTAPSPPSSPSRSPRSASFPPTPPASRGSLLVPGTKRLFPSQGVSGIMQRAPPDTACAPPGAR